ncbi:MULTISPECIES: peptidase inhibitor family I36 protein [Streptomyces]|uniref:peptidase inhibitor family I36 protein n=2 Tax=Streptomyces TaxID=1883 RepID=UPI0010520A3A|nr:peptidase inhibitor family I36 [Streptomyces sp. BK205]
MKSKRRALSLATAVTAAAAAVLGVAPMAHAEARESCPTWANDCAVFYYNSGFSGSRTAFTNDGVPNLAGYIYLSSGSGKGQTVKNNAASFWNASVDHIATVFFNSNYSGACDTFAPLADADKLARTYNENASFDFNRNGTNCYKWN